MVRRLFRIITLLLGGLCLGGSALALTEQEALAMAVGESDARIQAINQALANADDKTVHFLQALAEDAVKIAGQKALIVRGDQASDPVTGAAMTLPEGAEDVVSNNRMRGEIDSALASLRLLSPDIKVRRQAAQALQGQIDASKRALLEKALAAETDTELKNQLLLLRAGILLDSQERTERLQAARDLSGGRSPAARTVLIERLKAEDDAQVKAALQAALGAVEASLVWGDRLAVVFSGISLGSILLLVALGLAITYGLMGVINMAHGELMMIGAYATFVVQALFQRFVPEAFNLYLLAAVPASFGAAAAMGALLERGVIRFLYGRPLETLLATWGISLMLQQLVRSVFGAQNVSVENPTWMSGSMQLMSNLQLPWNRVLILVFAMVVLLAVAVLISKTRLGLFVRGVTQNRPMAACLGVNTARTDTYAFALGSGIAGLAGCALSQIGNVGPDLGQAYIVDAFMVVVVGGVGQLAGTVYAALGLGVVNKFLEGWTGAVLAKIAVLVIIIVFIQKRPQGLFAMRGRSAEA